MGVRSVSDRCQIPWVRRGRMSTGKRKRHEEGQKEINDEREERTGSCKRNRESRPQENFEETEEEEITRCNLAKMTLDFTDESELEDEQRSNTGRKTPEREQTSPTPEREEEREGMREEGARKRSYFQRNFVNITNPNIVPFIRKLFSYLLSNAGTTRGY